MTLLPCAAAVYYPTPDAIIGRMLKLADVSQKDMLYDLGCGDGRGTCSWYALTWPVLKVATWVATAVCVCCSAGCGGHRAWRTRSRDRARCGACSSSSRQRRTPSGGAPREDCQASAINCCSVHEVACSFVSLCCSLVCCQHPVQWNMALCIRAMHWCRKNVSQLHSCCFDASPAWHVAGAMHPRQTCQTPRCLLCTCPIRATSSWCKP